MQVFLPFLGSPVYFWEKSHEKKSENQKSLPRTWETLSGHRRDIWLFDFFLFQCELSLHYHVIVLWGAPLCSHKRCCRKSLSIFLLLSIQRGAKGKIKLPLLFLCPSRKWGSGLPAASAQFLWGEVWAKNELWAFGHQWGVFFPPPPLMAAAAFLLAQLIGWTDFVPPLTMFSRIFSLLLQSLSRRWLGVFFLTFLFIQPLRFSQRFSREKIISQPLLFLFSQFPLFKNTQNFPPFFPRVYTVDFGGGGLNGAIVSTPKFPTYFSERDTAGGRTKEGCNNKQPFAPIGPPPPLRQDSPRRHRRRQSTTEPCHTTWRKGRGGKSACVQESITGLGGRRRGGGEREGWVLRPSPPFPCLQFVLWGLHCGAYGERKEGRRKRLPPLLPRCLKPTHEHTHTFTNREKREKVTTSPASPYGKWTVKWTTKKHR